MWLFYLKYRLYRFISKELDDWEREIICKRYGIRNGRGYAGKALTQREIAKELGISRSCISRIEKNALALLVRWLVVYDIEKPHLGCHRVWKFAIDLA